eukprot:scaffold646_cov77-Phaeocystis_antarctica.AAC.9
MLERLSTVTGCESSECMSNPSAPSSERYFASVTGSVGLLAFGTMPSFVCIRLPLSASLEIASSESGASAKVRSMTELTHVAHVK